MNDSDLSTQKKLIIAIILAVGGGNLTSLLVNKSTDTVRHDPFTGTQGKALEHVINKMEQRLDRIDAEQVKMIWRMGQVEKSCNASTDKLQEHFRRHP